MKRVAFGIIAFLCIAPLVAEDGAAVLSRARGISDRRAAIDLLQLHLPENGNLRPYFLLELARLAGEGGDWPASLAWSESQREVPAEIADATAWWHGTALVSTGKGAAALSLWRARIATGNARDPALYLAYLRLLTSETVSATAAADGKDAIARLDRAVPSLRSSDAVSWALSRYLGGLASIRAGDWNSAYALLSRFSPEHESRFPELAPWGRYYLAYAAYRLGKREEAIAGFAYYLKTWERHPKGWEAATAAAVATIQSGGDALPFAERAVRLAPGPSERSESLLLQASLLFDLRRYDEADRILSSVAEGSGTAVPAAYAARAYLARAEIAVATGRVKDAESLWRSTADRFPGTPEAEEALYRRAERRYIDSDWAGAASAFRQYRQTWPSGRFIPSVLWYGGDALSRSKETELAILWLQESARRGGAPGAKAGGLERTIAPRAYERLVALYRERKEYGAALSAAREFRSAYPAEAGVAGIDAAIEELEGAAAGKSPDLVALEGEWARAGKGKTAAGRSAGVRLARLYLADYSRRAELVVLLREIHATLPRDFSKLQRRERADYAAAESMLGNVLREQGAFADAAVFLLTAGTLYAPVDVERAAESLYGAVDAFQQSGKRGDAESAFATMRQTWPDSVWTKRAARLVE